jgi:hypothetical protein
MFGPDRKPGRGPRLCSCAASRGAHDMPPAEPGDPAARAAGKLPVPGRRAGSRRRPGPQSHPLDARASTPTGALRRSHQPDSCLGRMARPDARSRNAASSHITGICSGHHTAADARAPGCRWAKVRQEWRCWRRHKRPGCSRTTTSARHTSQTCKAPSVQEADRRTGRRRAGVPPTRHRAREPTARAQA